jgi:2-hydroxychromene-2-carboxylate isomerase
MAATAPTAAIDFWLELASTYTYLAAARIGPAAAAAAVDVRWRPFSLGPIFAASGWATSPFNLQPAKGRYMWRDLERQCDALGLPFRRPSEFPRNSVLALRVALVGVERGFAPAFCQAVLRANFGEDRDIAAPAVLDEICGALGLDGPALRAEAESPAHKPRLRAAIGEAQVRGVFGAPSFIVGDELFWGNDRLEQALAWAQRYSTGSKPVSPPTTPTR